MLKTSFRTTVNLYPYKPQEGDGIVYGLAPDIWLNIKKYFFPEDAQFPSVSCEWAEGSHKIMF